MSRLQIEVVNTGTELLLGNVVNSHLAYFGRALWPLGCRISRQTTVPDGCEIRNLLIETLGRSEIVLVTGGLGPTTDDVTREISAELLGLSLVENTDVLESIKSRCQRRGFAFQERMGRQAMVPEGATVLANAFGTAPGLYLPPMETPSMVTPHLFLLPGPPRELQPMFESGVMPILKEILGSPSNLVCKTFRCVGIWESLVESRIGLRLSAIQGLEIGYCARPNEVDLRLIGTSELVEHLVAEVEAELTEFIVGEENDSLESLIVRLLAERRASVTTAESCTGGLLANRFTDISGASNVFQRGWITYSNEAKTSELGIDSARIDDHGAVSEPVARAMAEGARARASATFGLATTGIAGPTGGTQDQPVGTVWLAIAGESMETIAWKEYFPTDRLTFKQATTQAILNRFRQILRLQPVCG